MGNSSPIMLTKRYLRDLVNGEPSLSCDSLHRRTAFHRVRNIFDGESIVVRTGGRGARNTVGEVMAQIEKLRTPDPVALDLLNARRVRQAQKVCELRAQLLNTLEECEDLTDESLKTLGELSYRGAASALALAANSLRSLRSECERLENLIAEGGNHE